MRPYLQLIRMNWPWWSTSVEAGCTPQRSLLPPFSSVLQESTQNKTAQLICSQKNGLHDFTLVVHFNTRLEVSTIRAPFHDCDGSSCRAKTVDKLSDPSGAPRDLPSTNRIIPSGPPPSGIFWYACRLNKCIITVPTYTNKTMTIVWSKYRRF